MQTTCAVLTPRVVWCRARAPAGLAKLSQLLALSPWHFIAHGRSESSSKEQISARAFISEIRAHYRPRCESDVLSLSQNANAIGHQTGWCWRLGGMGIRMAF